MQPTNNRDVVLADFNNDGWLDFATAVTISDGDPKHISHPRIYMNQGAPGGTWLGFRFEAGRSPQLFVLDASGQPHGVPDARPLLLDRRGRRRRRRRRRTSTWATTTAASRREPAGIDINDRLWINDGTGIFSDSHQTRMSAQMLLSAFCGLGRHRRHQRRRGQGRGQEHRPAGSDST